MENTNYKAIVFDCETNGKIIDWKVKLNKNTISNFPRITQLGWQVIDIHTGTIENSFESIIYPDGWTVPKEQFFIDHNMSTERCIKEGKPLLDVMNIFIDDMRKCEIAVAHNMNFDMNVIAAEMMRLNLSVGKTLIKICTMKSTTDLLKLPSMYGRGYKYPKLTELYDYLFSKEMDGSNHDALSDVIACRECFVKLIELKYLVID